MALSFGRQNKPLFAKLCSFHEVSILLPPNLPGHCDPVQPSLNDPAASPDVPSNPHHAGILHEVADFYHLASISAQDSEELLVESELSMLSNKAVAIDALNLQNKASHIY